MQTFVHIVQLTYSNGIYVSNVPFYTFDVILSDCLNCEEFTYIC